MNQTNDLDPNKTPITGDQLYEQMMAQWGEKYGPEELEKIEGIIRNEAYDPAVLLARNTTACPSWCDKTHQPGSTDSAPFVEHSGPELLKVAYDGSPNPTAAGWDVALTAYEYVANPGRLHYVLQMAGDHDGLNGNGFSGWMFDFPVDRLRDLAAVLPALDGLLGGAL